MSLFTYFDYFILQHFSHQGFLNVLKYFLDTLYGLCEHGQACKGLVNPKRLYIICHTI